MEIFLIEKSKVRRTFKVIVDKEEHIIEYRGDGLGFESAFLDGREVVQHESFFKMAPLFEFDLKSHKVKIEVESGFCMNLLGPLWPGHLAMFRLCIDGTMLYEDRSGKEIGFGKS